MGDWSEAALPAADDSGRRSGTCIDDVEYVSTAGVSSAAVDLRVGLRVGVEAVGLQRLEAMARALAVVELVAQVVENLSTLLATDVVGLAVRRHADEPVTEEALDVRDPVQDKDLSLVFAEQDGLGHGVPLSLWYPSP